MLLSKIWSLRKLRSKSCTRLLIGYSARSTESGINYVIRLTSLLMGRSNFKQGLFLALNGGPSTCGGFRLAVVS